MRDFRALFIPTGNSGLVWWRMQSFIEAAWRTEAASFQNPLWEKDWNHIAKWQQLLTDDSMKPQPVMPDDRYDPGFLRRFVPMIESGCQGANAVVFQYAHLEGALELFDAIKIKFPRLPLLTEIDDNILSVPNYNEAAETFDPRSDVRRRIIAQLRGSDAVIVSTPYLKEIYSEFNANIYVVPNAIDFQQWDKIKGKKRPGIRILWAGGNGHEGDFEQYADEIKNVLGRHRDVKLVLVNGPSIHGIPPFFKDMPQVEHHAAWTPILKYPKMMMELDGDIGIAPVIDSAFNRGKSNLKWIENAAMRMPTVASNVGHLAETIHNGVDGFLCDSPAEFEEKLELLVTDKKLRRKMGQEANDRVRRDFNIDKMASYYVEVLKEVCQKKANGDLNSAFQIVEKAPEEAVLANPYEAI